MKSNIKTLQDCANAGSGGPGGGGAGRFLNNVDCARLVQTDGGPTDAATQDPPPQLIGQMDDGTSGYNIDPADFFGNAIACNGGSSESLGGALESNFPHCFFSVPVVRGAGDPCESPACIIENNPADVSPKLLEHTEHPRKATLTCARRASWKLCAPAAILRASKRYVRQRRIATTNSLLDHVVFAGMWISNFVLAPCTSTKRNGGSKQDCVEVKSAGVELCFSLARSV